MKVEKQFNKRAADLVEVQPEPGVHCGPQYALGIKVTFIRVINDPDRSTLALHLTADEALGLALQLVNAARRVSQ